MKVELTPALVCPILLKKIIFIFQEVLSILIISAILYFIKLFHIVRVLRISNHCYQK